MAKRRYSTRLESDEAIAIAQLPIWDQIVGLLYDAMDCNPDEEDSIQSLIDHIEYWVERTRFKSDL